MKAVILHTYSPEWLFSEELKIEKEEKICIKINDNQYIDPLLNHFDLKEIYPTIKSNIQITSGKININLENFSKEILKHIIDIGYLRNINKFIEEKFRELSIISESNINFSKQIKIEDETIIIPDDNSAIGKVGGIYPKATDENGNRTLSESQKKNQELEELIRKYGEDVLYKEMIKHFNQAKEDDNLACVEIYKIVEIIELRKFKDIYQKKAWEIFSLGKSDIIEAFDNIHKISNQTKDKGRHIPEKDENRKEKGGKPKTIFNFLDIKDQFLGYAKQIILHYLDYLEYENDK